MRVIGAKEFEKKLGAYPQLVGRAVESVLKQEARATCIKLAGAANPLGLKDDSRAQAMRLRVAKQVGEVFVSRNRSFAMVRELERRSPRLAAAYKRALAEGNQVQARRYLREAGFGTERLDPALHRKARTGPYGKVQWDGPAVLVTKPQLDAFTRRKQQNVGLAKAGWYAAALALGGRVRRNLKDPEGKRSTKEIFPAYVKRLARKYPGLGGARVSAKKVEVFTNVTYAEEAYIGSNYDDALYYARLSFEQAMRSELRRIRQSGFRDREAA